ncbi:MAG: hypothetical protein ABR899_09700, partial [Candidatus Krumholzibacteriaceae bacterium]
MKKVLTLGVVLVLMVFLSASMLVAQEKAAGEKEKGSWQKETKLTDEQKAKIHEMRTELRLKMIDLKAEREKLAIQLREEVMKPEPSMQDIQGILKKLSDAREKTQLAAIEHVIAMRKLLGPEWRTFMRGEMRERMGMMRERGTAGAGGEREEMFMRRPMRGMGERGGMMNMRTMRMRGREAREESGEEAGEQPGMMMMRRPGMGGENGCGMMNKGAMGAAGGMGEMKGCCTMMQKGGACCSEKSGNWHRMMFRPYGK